MYQPAPAEDFRDQPTGADLLFGSELIRQQFPFLTGDVKAMLHPRRCGWLSAQQLGMYLLDQARSSGVRLVNGRVTGIGIGDEYPKIYYRQDWEARRAYDGIIEAGMCVCVESYVGEQGGDEGVKLEQQILVTETGIELLSDYPFESELLSA